MKKTFASALLAFASLAPLIAIAQATSPSASAPTVRTQDGALSGLTTTAGIRAFLGVPFAAPPVRELRWRPPQPVAKWSGVKRADRFAAQCMQARIYDDMVFRNAGTSEDCLYLNVWAPPAATGARLPVLVYFYGGGFQAGDGSEPRYDGESMARRGIVAVTMSYRLGVFGFLAHPELTRESPNGASGNYGLMDQWAALRWVRENIAAFGGDPAQVTIAGESAGSFSVSAQMASPLTRGLFARAIGESGAFMSAPPRSAAEATGVALGTQLDAPSLAGLRAVSAMELVMATNGRPNALRFWPIVDGWFIAESPNVTFAEGRQAKVPLLAGWNSQEGSWRGLVRGTPTPDSVRAVFARLYGANAPDAARAYPAESDAEAMQALTDLAGDQFIGFATWKWLEEHARTGGQPTWRYFYARPRPPMADAPADSPPPPSGAVHSAEIEYAMGNLASNRVFAWTPDDHKVSATMQSYFVNFIKTGNPNASGLPEWPAGAPDGSGRVRRMRIDVDSRAEDEPRGRYLFLDRMSPARR